MEDKIYILLQTYVGLGEYADSFLTADSYYCPLDTCKTKVVFPKRSVGIFNSYQKSLNSNFCKVIIYVYHYINQKLLLKLSGKN